MATGAIIAATVLAAGATYMAYEGQEKQAKQSGKEAKRQAAVAKEREQRELKIERERMEYEANLAAEQAEWETEVSLERAEYTTERIQEEADLVLAAQKVGYAAAGLSIEGSPLAVISRTAKDAQREKEQVMRGHELFAEIRAKEAGEVAKGGETSFEWFKTRIHAETGYAVGSRLSEAKMFRTKAKYAGIGKHLSTGASLLSGGAQAKISHSRYGW